MSFEATDTSLDTCKRVTITSGHQQHSDASRANPEVHRFMMSVWHLIRRSGGIGWGGRRHFTGAFVYVYHNKAWDKYATSHSHGTVSNLRLQ